MKKIGAVAVAAALGLFCSVILAYISLYISGFAYRYFRQIPQSIDLSEDYGMGMIGFGAMLLCVVITFPLGTYLWFKFLQKYIN